MLTLLFVVIIIIIIIITEYFLVFVVIITIIIITLITKSKQFTHRVLPHVLCRALMSDDERAVCRLDTVVHPAHVPRQRDDTQQLCVGRVVLT